MSTRITVFRGWIDPGKFVWSPYVTKLEARLRFGQVPYTTDGGSPRSAPKGKIPYVNVSPPLRATSGDGIGSTAGGDDGKTAPAETEQLGDSTLIAKALCNAGIMPDLNARLTKAERAHDLALRALLEDKVTFYHVWERWTQNYYTMRDHVLWPIPWAVRVFVGSMAYKKAVATLQGQGTGRLTAEEIGQFRREVWESLADLLEDAKAKTKTRTKTKGVDDDNDDEPFWLLAGPAPTEADTTLFGFVVSTLLCTAGPASQADLKSFPILGDYARRIQKKYFPDYEALPL